MNADSIGVYLLPSTVKKKRPVSSRGETRTLTGRANVRAAGLRACSDGFIDYTPGIPIQKIFVKETIMNTLLLVSSIALWAVVFVLGFLLLGTLRSLRLLGWRFDELEATRPVRKGREGLARGKQAPDFTLPSAAAGEVSLRDFAGRKVLLVFTQSGCGPCHDVMPELNRVQAKGEHQVLVVNSGEPQDAAEMAAEIRARFPIVTQKDWELSKRYQVFATPYAFVVDERGTIASKGIAGNTQYLRNVLTGAGNRKKAHHEDDALQNGSTVEPKSENSRSSKEVTHA